jgi:hypothetical protein
VSWAAAAGVVAAAAADVEAGAEEDEVVGCVAGAWVVAGGAGAVVGVGVLEVQPGSTKLAINTIAKAIVSHRE